MWLMGLGGWLEKSFSQPETGKQPAGFAGANRCESKLRTALGCVLGTSSITLKRARHVIKKINNLGLADAVFWVRNRV